MPAPQNYLYCSDADVRGLLSALGTDARLDDDASGVVEADEALQLRQAREYATTRVKFYCLLHYEDADLATSWLVNEWATILAAHWLCSRRCNPVPDAIRDLAYGDGSQTNRGAMGDLLDIRAKKAQIPDCGYRNVDWPAWSNVTVDARYRLRQIRVQRPISEKTPTQYPQNVDWTAEGTTEI